MVNTVGRLGIGAARATHSEWPPRPRLTAEHVLFGALALGLAYFILPPLVMLVVTSFQAERRGTVVGYALENYQALLALDGATPTVLLNSLVFAAGSALVGVTLGGTLAWLAERTNAPFKGLLYITAFVSFAIPGIVKVVGWILLLGPQSGLINVALRQLLGLEGSPFNVFSLGGMILLEGLLWTPVVFLLLASTFRSMDPNLEEAAATSGSGPWQTLWRVTLRLALPTTFSVLILTVIRSLEGFEIPVLIGIPARVEVLTTIVYERIRSGIVPRYGEASAYSVVLVLVVVAMLYPYTRLTRQASKYATISGKGFRPRVKDLGRWRYLAGALNVLLPALILLPLPVLLWASLLPFYQAPSSEALKVLTFTNYAKVFGDTNAATSLGNSLIIGLTSATLVMLMALLLAWLVFRTRVRGRWALENLGTLPLVFPGIVLGVAVLRTYLTLPIPIYGTIWIIAVAFVARYMPYGIRFGEAGLLQIQRDLEESAQVSGASFVGVLRRIVVPLMMPALFGGWIYIFLLSVKELSLAILLYGPQSAVISATMFDLWQNGQVTELSAFCIVMTMIFIALGLVFYRLSRRYGFTT
jgi:iron(III) transport system permease protein